MKTRLHSRARTRRPVQEQLSLIDRLRMYLLEDCHTLRVKKQSWRSSDPGSQSFSLTREGLDGCTREVRIEPLPSGCEEKSFGLYRECFAVSARIAKDGKTFHVLLGFVPISRKEEVRRDRLAGRIDAALTLVDHLDFDDLICAP